MKKISVLDCTLRDGGYCNAWKFGKENIEYIISKLVDAEIDVIECGFLTNKGTYQSDCTLFDSIAKAESFIKHKGKSSFALMVNYGEFDAADIPEYNGGCIDTIRVAFHKKHIDEALELCKEIRNKGYKVFVQAMVSLSYSTEEFECLINKVNEVSPYAFYIVDSFGVMKTDTLVNYMNLVADKLDKSIVIGFHSHNNMQLSYSNAQMFCSLSYNREIVVDSSIMGMGRGAGNLNTELFTEYLNDKYGTTYDLTPLLQAIDEVVNDFHQKNGWGYTLPNYLSAKHNLHPNYARFLDNKKTLSVKDVDEIFKAFSDDKKLNYDEEYISRLYLEFMSANTVTKNTGTLKNALLGKTVILVAPGKSAEIEKNKVSDMANGDVVVVSVNHNYEHCKTDFVFVSNKRKAVDFNKKENSLLISTSNVEMENSDIVVDYRSLINDKKFVKDNAGLMAIKMLINFGAKKVLLAGFDGYSGDYSEDYSSGNKIMVNNKLVAENLNDGMNEMLCEYSKVIDVEFLTATKYLKL